MVTSLQWILEQPALPAQLIAERTAAIHAALIRQSRHLDGANFTAIHTHDLHRLFALYDDSFFEKQIQKTLGQTRLLLNLSTRMTSAGGTTTRYRLPGKSAPPQFEITISTTLLFQSFLDEERPILVSGCVCRDRLEAMQRIFEHELVHLMEMLLWNDSSCSASRFQTIAQRVFGHTDHRHGLITSRERALTKFGVRPGDRVRFRFDGAEYQGRINRITRRATVLVEDAQGTLYSDGKRYRKFYVPLNLLTREQ
jgi:hypothetical protein